MASAEREPMTGVWAKAPGQGIRGPPEAEGVLSTDCLLEGQNLHLLGIFQTVHNSKIWLNGKEWQHIRSAAVSLFFSLRSSDTSFLRK